MGERHPLATTYTAGTIAVLAVAGVLAVDSIRRGQPVAGAAAVGLAVVFAALLTWGRLLVRQVDQRAQMDGPGAFTVPAFAIAVAVAVLVGREMLATWRDELATCAPDCSLGAPLFTGVEWVGAGILLALLGGIVLSGVRGRGERDE